jgi:hypothetical protein
MQHTLTPPEHAVWRAAHGSGTGEEDGRWRWTRGRLLDLAADPDAGAALERLLGRGLLAEVEVEGAGARDFAASHQIHPSLYGLGNPAGTGVLTYLPPQANVAAVGLVGRASGSVAPFVHEVWSWAPAFSTLWAAVEESAALRTRAFTPDARLDTSEKVLARFLERVHSLLAVGGAYIDTAASAPPPAPRAMGSVISERFASPVRRSPRAARDDTILLPIGHFNRRLIPLDEMTGAVIRSYGIPTDRRSWVTGAVRVGGTWCPLGVDELLVWLAAHGSRDAVRRIPVTPRVVARTARQAGVRKAESVIEELKRGGLLVPVRPSAMDHEVGTARSLFVRPLLDRLPSTAAGGVDGIGLRPHSPTMTMGFDPSQVLPPTVRVSTDLLTATMRPPDDLRFQPTRAEFDLWATAHPSDSWWAWCERRSQVTGRSPEDFLAESATQLHPLLAHGAVYLDR